MSNLTKTLIGLVGIAAIIAIMLLLSILPTFVIVLMIVACFVPGFIHLYRAILIKGNKYPAVEARVVNRQGVFIEERKDIYEIERDHLNPSYYSESSSTGVSEQVGSNGNIEYVVGGTTYMKYMTMPEDGLYKQTGVIDIYYNPSNPKKAYLQEYVSKTWVPFVVGGVTTSIILLLYFLAC